MNDGEPPAVMRIVHSIEGDAYVPRPRRTSCGLAPSEVTCLATSTAWEARARWRPGFAPCEACERAASERAAA